MKGIFLVFFLFLLFPVTTLAEPPFSSSVYISTDIIKKYDAELDYSVVYEGVSAQDVHDDRVGESLTLDIFVFTTTYSDGHFVTHWVNPEFEDEALAQEEVDSIASAIGRLPTVLRLGLERVIYHKGRERWRAGCGGLIVSGGVMTIYTDHTPEYDWAGYLEELLIHELGHASLDCIYKPMDEWRVAQEADGEFITQYAHDYPNAEDMTESYLAYLAWRTRRDRIGEETARIIEETIPARLAFFKKLGLDVAPLEYPFQITAGHSGSWYDPATAGQGFFLEVLPKSEQIFLGWYTFDMERPAIASGVMGDSGQRWMTALGPYEGDTATLTVYQTEGGVFDAENPKPITDPKGDGTITLEFESCTKGFVHYEIDSTGASGSIPIERIANDNAELCEAMVARDGQVPK